MTSRAALPSAFLAILFSICLPTWAEEGAAGAAPPPGFQALFNGRDLEGWKGLIEPPARAKMNPEELKKAQEAADARMREHWSPKDGILVFDGKGQNLCTAKDYGDFELLVDWKILEKGDSGIYVRGSPQVQIWDDPVGSGGLYNNQNHLSKPLDRADRPAGEWNTFHIWMVGDRVTVHLNGVPVVVDTVLESYWEKGKPIYPTGSIELQNHGNTLYFRNVFARELPRSRENGETRPLVKKGALVAIAGDSITEQKQYSRMIETYILACASHLDARCVQLGWGGERASGFADRMANDLLPFKPDVVTTCYGMNDGQYRPYEPAIGDAYKRPMQEIVRALKAAGALVVVGSPGAVDTYSFRGRLDPAVYNANLASLRDIARDVASEEGMPFANVHDAMVIAMRRAKRALGEAYDVCGSDGFHPQANGHLVMAQAFLKALGFDGEIGRITLDMKGDAAVSEGHRVLRRSGSSWEIESSRYPFCFQGDEKSPGGTRSIVAFTPFNEELNRFVLIVKGLEKPRAKVTWGSASKTFSKEELEKGINLAQEFLENPFRDSFRKLDEVVARKQNFETALIKEVVTKFRTARDLLGGDEEGKAALTKVHDRLLAREKALQDEARAAVAPVKHTIGVEPE